MRRRTNCARSRPQALQLVVSDGSNGLLDAMGERLPAARQQRCITQKIHGMKKHLQFFDLPEQE